MSALIECVPNFSEGRDRGTIEAIVDAIRTVPGAYVLDYSSDPDHNRTVVTFAGAPEPVTEAAFRAIARAAELVDLDRHAGEHPRLGATDVVPLIPVRDISMEACAELARRLGERVGRELGIAVYLYAHAAQRPERVRLPDIRRGEYERWKEVVGRDPAHEPDFGPAEPRSWGATTIGARPFLIAYNLYLDSDDLAVARAIARVIRESSGGLRHVQARGFLVGGAAQVSMNLLNFRETPLHLVQDAVRREAAARGATIASAELIGLIPADALLSAARWHLKLEELSDDQIFERRLAAVVPPEPTVPEFVENVAAGTPTPGGGSVAAIVGALAAALAEMMANLSRGRRFAAVEEEVAEILAEIGPLRRRLLAAAAADSAAFEELMRLWRDRQMDPELRREELERATRRAGEIPLAVARDCRTVVELAERIVIEGNANAITDGAAAALLAAAGVRVAGLNVLINARQLQDRELARSWRLELDELESVAASMAERVNSHAAERGGYV